MKKTILSTLVMLVAASAFAQSRFMPITMTLEDVGRKQYSVLYDIVLSSHSDAYYVFEVAPSFYRESFLFVERDGLTTVGLDRELWSYYYRKYLVPISIKDWKENLNDPDSDKKFVKDQIKKKRKMHRQHGPKPKINYEKTLKTDRNFIQALENLIHVATLSATDIDNPWTQLDGVVYDLYPLNSSWGMAIQSQDPQDNTIEDHFIKIMNELMVMTDDGVQPDNAFMMRMKANYLEFLEYMPKGNDYTYYLEQLKLFDIYQ